MATRTLACLWLACGLAAPLGACDTPVYEYALLHWARGDYTVYYLHDGKEATADAQANALLRQVARGAKGHANLRLVEGDARDVDRLTPEARGVLDADGELPRPRHVFVSPRGCVLYSGRMTAADVRDLLASPKTCALADMLCKGAQGVLVLLADGDDARNQDALATVRTVVEDARRAGRQVGVLELSRQDVAERWLVRELLAVETDLAQIRGPMVFGAFGRCQVTEAYLGKGISAANLTSLVQLMNGPCPCEVKAANVGVSLVSDWDWDTQVPGAGPDPRPAEPRGYVTFGDE